MGEDNYESLTYFLACQTPTRENKRIEEELRQRTATDPRATRRSTRTRKFAGERVDSLRKAAEEGKKPEFLAEKPKRKRARKVAEMGMIVHPQHFEIERKKKEEAERKKREQKEEAARKKAEKKRKHDAEVEEVKQVRKQFAEKEKRIRVLQKEKEQAEKKLEKLQKENEKLKEKMEKAYQFCSCKTYLENKAMVGCDCKTAKDCPGRGWFHLQCVGLRKAPKGPWICASCKDHARKA